MLFFFSRAGKKKQPFEIESVSAFQTFPGKKKQIKKKTTFGKKKKQNQNLKNGKKMGNWFLSALVFLKNCLLHSLFKDFMF